MRDQSCKTPKQTPCKRHSPNVLTYKLLKFIAETFYRLPRHMKACAVNDIGATDGSKTATAICRDMFHILFCHFSCVVCQSFNMILLLSRSVMVMC